MEYILMYIVDMNIQRFQLSPAVSLLQALDIIDQDQSGDLGEDEVKTLLAAMGYLATSRGIWCAYWVDLSCMLMYVVGWVERCRKTMQQRR